MKKIHVLLIAVISTAFSVYGQQTKTIENEYAAYFTLPREGLYLHVNKTSFFSGEEIWFKGYAYDQKNQLISKATTNINVGIYDAEGNQVKKALFKAKDGYAQGNFAVDSTFTAGTYYIKADTNWMKNFKEDNSFVQKIEIITEEEASKKKVTTEARFDFQFLPEGGHIISDAICNIGFKVLNEEGKGVSASGIVYNQNNEEITSFESNALGMGKFQLHPKKDANYTAKITLEDGSVITKALPEAEAEGITMILQNFSEDKIIIDFSTNEETLQKNRNKKYKVLIHQNGKLKTANFKFSDTEKAVSLQKDQLFKGINTITVFDDNKNPILERLFFNEHGIKKADINIDKVTATQDSITLSIKELSFNENANVSISVLPEVTKSYSPQHNILSNFYLKPHVKGFVENAPYYFHNMNKKKKYELDVLLLTQGWSRYDWNDIFSKKPNGLNRFENGMTVSGRVNRPATGVKRVFLHATKNHPAGFVDVNEKQEFTIDNFFLEEGEEIRFSYEDPKGILKKPGMYVRFKVNNTKDRISEMLLNDMKRKTTTTANFSIPKSFFYEDAVALDAVVVTKNTKEVYKDPILVNAKVTDFGEQEYSRFINVTDFINYNGYQVSEDFGRVAIVTRRQPKATPVIYFDGARITNFSILFQLSSFNIERVVIDKTGVGEGVNAGFGGVIKIYTRKTPLFKKGESSTIVYTAAKAPYAFAPAKKYYAPNYTSYRNKIFQKYGAISWIPELKLDKTSTTNFKIFDTKTKNITLFIEGISENGDLISEKKTIQIR